MLKQMRLSLISAILLCILAPVTTIQSTKIAKPQNYQKAIAYPAKPWTFFVYMARDNSLSDFGVININAMKSINNPNVNIVVYDCSKINGKKQAQMLLITHNKVQVLQSASNVDSGSEATFTNACLWVAQNFPSDKFAIIAWNHGSGMLNRSELFNNFMHRGFCYDDTTGHYINDIQLMRSLSTIVKARNGKKIDIFGFDACLMADVEIMASLAPYTNYAVASQQTIPGEGWPYDYVLNSLAKDTTASTFSGQIVTAYNKYYNKTSDSFTLSAVDLSQADALNSSLGLLSTLLIQALKTDSTLAAKTAITNAVNNYFDEATYMDLYTFCASLLNTISSMKINDKSLTQNLQAALALTMKNVRACVKTNTHSSDLPNAIGLSIYFPQDFVESSYAATYFGQRNNWLKFINYYMNN